MSGRMSACRFSFVMPVYNVEEYINEAIESVLQQTMNFTDNCEIILINDGSTDNSEKVCLEYAYKYPNNIKYIKQKNQGVSAARNRGIKEASGEYVSFLDSDDKISSDTLDEVHSFFSKHGEEIDIVAIKMIRFDASSGNHMLNYKFDSNRVIDITKDYHDIQLSGGSIFVKRSCLEGIEFDTNLRLLEDVKLITHLLQNKLAYGVVSDPVYYYRTRQDGGSAVNSKVVSKDWYFDVVQKVYEDLIQLSLRKYNTVTHYIQYLIMYDLQWRFKQTAQSILSTQELKDYKKSLYNILQYIDDDIILEQRHINLAVKIFILEKKHNKTIDQMISVRDSIYLLNGKEFDTSYVAIDKARIARIDVLNEVLIIEGYTDSPVIEGSQLNVCVDKTVVPVRYTDTSWSTVTFLGDVIYSNNTFVAEIPLSEYKDIGITLTTPSETLRIEMVLGKFTYLNNRSNSAYKARNGYIIHRKSSHSFSLQTHTVGRRLKREVKYLFSIAKRLKLWYVKDSLKKFKNKEWYIQQPGHSTIDTKAVLNDFRWILVPIKSLLSNIYTIVIRLLYFTFKMIIRKEIWLLSDRATTCGDNADYLFRYISSLPKHEQPVVYFALKPDNKGFNELVQIGRVVRYDGLKYKLLFLLASKRISSHFDYYIINAFGTKVGDFIDLYEFDYIYLGHGVLTSDSSQLFGRLHKNASLLTLASDSEKQAILANKKYGYNENQLQVTGLPRFDPLVPITSKKIIFMPTWRASLAGKVRQVNGAAGYDREYSNDFKQTDYFNFYNNLMNDKRVINLLKATDYSIEFYIHPSLSMQWQDFTTNKYVSIMTPPHDYVTAMRQGALMVTDYSGVAFDFAYMKKPVIYTQYDKETLYQHHYYEKGYFDFEKHGFGEVTYTYEDSVSAIIKTIENDCVMPKKYQKRVDTFFTYTDSNNAKRVYEAITKA